MPTWKLAYHANCWGPLGGDAVGVTSISRLAYRTFGDMRRAAREIAEAGYEGIEVFDGNLLDCAAEDFAPMRRDLGRDPADARRGLQRCQFHLRRCAGGGTRADRRKAARGRPRARGRPSRGRRGGAPPRRDAIRRLRRPGCAGSTGSCASRRTHGLRAHYHPHLSTIVETPDEVRTIFAKTAIDFCPDTAHLAAAGADVAAMVREHHDADLLCASQGNAVRALRLRAGRARRLRQRRRHWGARRHRLPRVGSATSSTPGPIPLRGAKESLAFVKQRMASPVRSRRLCRHRLRKGDRMAPRSGPSPRTSAGRSRPRWRGSSRATTRPGAREADTVTFLDRYLSGLDHIYARPDGSGFETLKGQTGRSLAPAYRDPARARYRDGLRDLDVRARTLAGRRRFRRSDAGSAGRGAARPRPGGNRAVPATMAVSDSSAEPRLGRAGFAADLDRESTSASSRCSSPTRARGFTRTRSMAATRGMWAGG